MDEVSSERERVQAYDRALYRRRREALGFTVVPKPRLKTDFEAICREILDEEVRKMINQGARMGEIDK